MLHIVTVCGLGVGSSLILKITVDNVMKELGIKCNIEHWDMGTVKGRNADLIVTTSGFKKNFEGQDNVIFIDNIVDEKEVKDKLSAYFEKNK
ncbi:PTS sugar transporter subunit IIB [Sporanaerobacter acetigenes]|uniref:PTS system, ascorbate-specific IIB component n=1 Tax=Sporanaerobacter acetigenes DSM 13106 TaxID=1123281 RepID=A0A1M5VC07_9FIRM|nr:PTS sugar transporter subunit IIB [Sporanaerobacter acetigenes]SHH72644.1 PTS system, ascorbate-specific IIB component [Sporanaerobacter acetigenes DSM 13106]